MTPSVSRIGSISWAWRSEWLGDQVPPRAASSGAVGSGRGPFRSTAPEENSPAAGTEEGAWGEEAPTAFGGDTRASRQRSCSGPGLALTTPSVSGNGGISWAWGLRVAGRSSPWGWATKFIRRQSSTVQGMPPPRPSPARYLAGEGDASYAQRRKAATGGRGRAAGSVAVGSGRGPVRSTAPEENSPAAGTEEGAWGEEAPAAFGGDTRTSRQRSCSGPGFAGPAAGQDGTPAVPRPRARARVRAEGLAQISHSPWASWRELPGRRPSLAVPSVAFRCRLPPAGALGTRRDGRVGRRFRLAASGG